jgi:L-arabinose isomerase
LALATPKFKTSVSLGARAFINRWNEQGPAHHCAVGIGHVGDKLAKLGRLLNIDVVRIC